MRAALAELEDVLLAAIIDLRRAIFALRPVDLDELGFFPGATQLVSDFGDQNQLIARLDISGQRDALPAVYELPLYRIIQERMNNISQHARATSVLVRVAVDATGSGVVSVHDDGHGFDPSQLGPADRAGHFGLRRCASASWDLNGTLDIRSARGPGRNWSSPYHRSPKRLTMPLIRILIADDHTLVRQGLRQLCEGLGGFTVVAEAENGAQAVALARTAQPDVILMDIVMPDVDGVEAIRQIMHETPTARIIAVTMYRQEQYMLFDAIRAGARGYLLKTVDAADLIAAIEAVHRGDYLIDPIIAARVLSELRQGMPELPPVEPLTESEMAVLRLVAQGVDNQDIAQSLNNSVYTVANRLRTIYEKLHVTNRTQAALYALRQGWAALDEPARLAPPGYPPSFLPSHTVCRLHYKLL